MSLRKSSTELLQYDPAEGCNMLSVYRGELKQETVAKSVAKIKAAFPALTPEFFKLLIDRFKEKEFTDERLIDAVNSVIDNCQYPTPTMANFLSFDKRVKVLSYDELCNIVTRHEATFDSYTRIKINSKFFYVRIADKELYNLPDSI